MKKGFTLIELLAVIIILAVVSIIATPIVLDVVNDAKESTNRDIAYNIIDAGKLFYSESMFDENKANSVNNLSNIYEPLILSGKKPDNGELYVNNSGNVALSIVIDNKCYKKEFAGELEVTDGKECTLGYVGNDREAPTVSISLTSGSINTNGWLNSDFGLTIEVVDADSKPYSYKWCTDSVECEPTSLVKYSETILNDTILISGKFFNRETNGTVLCVIGYDNAGYASNKICSDTYKLDKTAPQFSGISDVIVDKDSIIDLTSGVTASDSLSGIDGDFIYNPSTVDTSIAGTTNVVYSVSDLAGNNTTITRKIIVDAEAPKITFIDKNNKINGNGWSKEDFYVDVTLVDKSGTGIKSSKWCTIQGDTCTPNAEMLGTSITPLISTESNNNRICIETTDNNNKTTTMCSDAYKLDKTIPTVGRININGTIGSNGWYISNVAISSTDGTDSLSGHASTNLNVTSVTNNTTGIEVTLSTTDLAGNINTVTSIIKKDDVTPSIAMLETETVNNLLDNVSMATTNFGVSSGTINCSDFLGNIYTSVPTSAMLALGRNTISCTITGNNGLSSNNSKTFTINGNFDTNNLFTINGASIENGKIVIPNGGVQFGPYRRALTGCYKIEIYGSNFTENMWVSAYENNGNGYDARFIDIQSNKITYYIDVTANAINSGLEFSMSNTGSNIIYVTNIVATYQNSCPTEKNKPTISNLSAKGYVGGNTVSAILTDDTSVAGYYITNDSNYSCNGSVPTAWNSISGKNYNLSVNLDNSALTYYLWVKDTYNNTNCTSKTLYYVTSSQFSTVTCPINSTSLIDSGTQLVASINANCQCLSHGTCKGGYDSGTDSDRSRIIVSVYNSTVTQYIIGSRNFNYGFQDFAYISSSSTPLNATGTINAYSNGYLDLSVGAGYSSPTTNIASATINKVVADSTIIYNSGFVNY